MGAFFGFGLSVLPTAPRTDSAIGQPHFGQLTAAFDTCVLHSGQLIRAITVYPFTGSQVPRGKPDP
jgi:hypothetical protein